MTDLRDAARQALEALESRGATREMHYHIITALRAALEQPEHGPYWLTKELMADYLDMVAEAIDNNSGQMLRDKAYWLLRRGGA